ncbi:MAG: Ig-like domain-containing protein [Ardenticatenales bacterium]
MRIRIRILLALTAVGGALAYALAVAVLPSAGAGQARLLAWNDSGLHEMEAGYDIYAVEPPGNNVRAQLVDANGRRVRPEAGGVHLTYEAVPDEMGSINATSIGKTDFWASAMALFGHQPAADAGLSGSAMPGAANAPQPMPADPAHGGWAADGIPITRHDDAGRVNPYPLLRVKAFEASGTLLASADVVLPVSDETACVRCHASNTVGAARPEDGWVNNPDPERDYRLNVLRRHDDRHRGDAIYTAGLAANGYLASGLYDTVLTAGKPVLCTACHAGGSAMAPGRADTTTLTRAMHYRHATVIDPATSKSLNASTDRSSCYTCHAGAQTQHLRGAMGHAVATDGSLAMQCQSCHGNMQALGNRDRKAWQDLPNCQSCHTGTAVKNSGDLRFTSAFDASGKVRAAADPLFATNPDKPSAGLSLYKESTGHGGLACAACHGSQHAEYPSRGGNDNVQAMQVQGHTGSIGDCGSCHAATLTTVTGGPHNMHPITNEWARRHAEPARQNLAACQACHGADDRGTVLSRAWGDRRFQAEGMSINAWKGYQIGCYNCHNGPRTDHTSGNRPAVVRDASLTTATGRPVGVDLDATDPDGDALTLRIVRQGEHGRVALADRHATYQPDADFEGVDTFTFAAWDNQTDSNLGTVRITVGSGVPSPTAAGPSPTSVATAAPTAMATDAPTNTPGAPPTETATVEETAGPARWRAYLPWGSRH